MYKVGIVGLGNISSKYGTPEDQAPYSHAGGIDHSDKVELSAVADMDEEPRQTFRRKWGTRFPQTRSYETLAKMLDCEDLDIVSVCVRGPHHHPVLMQVIEAEPRAIFLEKPPTCSLVQMDEVVAAAQGRNIPITVSYTRHWGPHVLRMAQLIKEGLIGQVASVVGYCGHSFLSFASHTTDMICQFAGYCPRAVYARGATTSGEVPPGYEPEPALLSMIVEFDNGVLGTQIGQQGEHGAFYCEVAGSAGRAHIPFYGPPAAWAENNEPIDLETRAITAPASPFKMAYEQIAAHLDGGPLPDCTNEDFIAVHEICFAGIESALTNQRIELPNRNRERLVFANG